MTRAGILTVSDSCAFSGARDETGPRLQQALVAHGIVVEQMAVVADERECIADHLRHLVDALRLDLIVTTGGTGFGPRDVTPEATLDAIERLTPGIAEALRAETRKTNPRSILSRAVAGLRGKSLIVNLPGNPDGAVACLEMLLPLVPHAMEMITGAGHGKRDGHQHTA